MKKILLNYSKLALIIIAFASSTFSVKALTQTVQVASYSFTPSNFTINIGDTIKWVWVSGTHNTTSNSVPAGAAPWANPMTSSSTTFKYVPTVAGIYHYECTFHSSMQAQFTVNSPCQVPVFPTGPSVNSAICSGGSTMFDVTANFATSY